MIITTIIIIFIFYQVYVFSMNVSLPYSPTMNTDIDYHQTFCSSCVVSHAIFVREEKPVLANNAERQAR